MNYTDHSVDRIVQITKTDAQMIGLSESGKIYSWERDRRIWKFLGDSPRND